MLKTEREGPKGLLFRKQKVSFLFLVFFFVANERKREISFFREREREREKREAFFLFKERTIFLIDERERMSRGD